MPETPTVRRPAEPVPSRTWTLYVEVPVFVVLYETRLRPGWVTQTVGFARSASTATTVIVTTWPAAGVVSDVPIRIPPLYTHACSVVVVMPSATVTWAR